jgi:hypothetical protein
MRMEADSTSETFCSILEYGTMDNAQKASNTKCNMPLLEALRTGLQIDSV